MSPVAGVKFLRVLQQVILIGSGIKLRRKIRDVGETLLFVDDQIFNNRQILGLGLVDQVTRRVAVGSSIVHVDVRISTHPSSVGTLPLDGTQRNVVLSDFSCCNI